ncbi:hypothetical protein EUX98_g6842 [Antrodiella citrinella]|uniref:Uncharacterized protein n=1 Tax=Antrodiella citrinella TaxID=2447956 RepID=A0A4S4MN04_9APHY|nr:hypothetical protein EUX98_g6842 [Antrodiella citrinella]
MDVSLPPELRIAIATNIRGDTATLKALSTVSRSWQAPAQFVLFETLNIVVRPLADLHSVVRLFRTQWAHLTEYVHALGLCNPRLWHRYPWESKYAPPSMSVLDVLALVALFPNLRALVVYRCLVEDTPKTISESEVLAQEDLRVPMSVLTRKLSISETHISASALHRLLDHLSPVVEFSASKTFVKDFTRSPAGSDSDTFLPAAHTVEIGSGVGVIQFEFDDNQTFALPRSPLPLSKVDLLTASQKEVIKSLGMTCTLTDARDVDATCDYLEAKGRGLEALRMDFTRTRVDFHADERCASLPFLIVIALSLGCSFVSSAQRWRRVHSDGFGRMHPECARTVNLSTHCPALKSLTFALLVTKDHELPKHATRPTSDFFVQWRYALRLLASASAPTEVTLCLTFDSSAYARMDECQFGMVHWDQWDAVLRDLEGLERVVLVRRVNDIGLVQLPLEFECRSLRFDFFEPFESQEPLVRPWRDDVKAYFACALPSVQDRLVFV